MEHASSDRSAMEKEDQKAFLQKLIGVIGV